MNCLTTASLLACLLDPSSLSISATAASHITGDFTFYVDNREVKPLWGRLAVEMKPQLTDSLQLIWGWEHISVINAPDRGEERLFGGFVWTPFKRN